MEVEWIALAIAVVSLGWQVRSEVKTHREKIRARFVLTGARGTDGTETISLKNTSDADANAVQVVLMFDDADKRYGAWEMSNIPGGHEKPLTSEHGGPEWLYDAVIRDDLSQWNQVLRQKRVELARVRWRDRDGKRKTQRIRFRGRLTFHPHGG